MNWSQAALCADVTYILGLRDGEAPQRDHLNHQFEVSKAAASYVKNHRVNPHDAFDVINVLWPQPGPKDVKDEDDEAAMDREAPARYRLRKDEKDRIELAQTRATSQVDERNLCLSVVVFDVIFPDRSMGLITLVDGVGEYDFVSDGPGA